MPGHAAADEALDLGDLRVAIVLAQRAAPDHLDPELLAGLVRAGVDALPELVRRPLRDDRDGDRAGRRGRCPARRWREQPRGCGARRSRRHRPSTASACGSSTSLLLARGSMCRLPVSASQIPQVLRRAAEHAGALLRRAAAERVLAPAPSSARTSWPACRPASPIRPSAARPEALERRVDVRPQLLRRPRAASPLR